MPPPIHSGTKTMRQMRLSLGTFVLVFAIAAPMATAAAQGQWACGQIRAACMNAGFMPGAAREGIGLQVHCIVPIMQGQAQPWRARRPLPKVSPQLVADCKASRAARILPRSEVIAPALPRNGNQSAPYLGRQPVVPGRDVVLRPPMPMTTEQRSVLAALPPEDQPETGPTKALPSQFRRTTIDYRSKEPAGTIIIDTPHTHLYLVLGNGKAIRYGIGVGREGFTWSGAEKVTKMAEWPDWHPPEEMIARQPYLPRFMAGGEGNPLGARALYLGETLYRIHGTNQPSTIGTFVSSGCIRLTNEDIADLYSRVKLGTRVVVLPGNATGPQVQATANTRRDTQPRERPKAAAAEQPAATPKAKVPAQASQPPAIGGEKASKNFASAIPEAPSTTAPSPDGEE
jgi:lipoprotein-anchoring transpeptidase ErfK/SrfK